ncbi:hypothetical protein PSTT_16644, partial [Puccinia striiformis]
DTTNDSSCSMVTDDNRSSLLSSDSASSPRPGLPQTPPRYDTEPPSIQVGHTLSRDDQQFWPNSHDPQTPSCSTHSEYLGPGLANPSTEFALESPSPYITNPDTSTVILQPPAHAQSQPHVLIAKPSIQQEQRHEVNPFSQLSARTLALMDQPESEVTIYDCEYCEKTIKDISPTSTKFRCPPSPAAHTWIMSQSLTFFEQMQTDPRLKKIVARGPGRVSAVGPEKPSCEESRARSAKELDGACDALLQTLQHSTPDRSQAPSPTMYTSSHGHPTAGSPEYFLAAKPHSHNPPCQSGPVAQVTFSHYPAMSAHASLSLANVPYSPLFPIGQGSAPSEWYLHSANSKPSSYPFGNYSAPTDTHFTFQLSDRFNAEGNHSKGNHSSYSPPFSQTRSLHQSPPTTYGTAVNQQESDDRRELPDCYTSAPTTLLSDSGPSSGIDKSPKWVLYNEIFDSAMNFKKDQPMTLIDKLEVKLTSDQRDAEGKALLKIIMAKFLPAGDSLSDVIAQRYRVETLYKGPMDDESAIGIRDRDPNAPLMLYVSKMVMKFSVSPVVQVAVQVKNANDLPKLKQERVTLSFEACEACEVLSFALDRQLEKLGLDLGVRSYNNRHSELSLNIQPHDFADPTSHITWSGRNYVHTKPFPHVMQENFRRPTLVELEAARTVVEPFHLFKWGKVVVTDNEDRGAIIAVIEFTPISDLSPQEKTDINTVTTFLHACKPFVRPMDSPARVCVWGGGGGANACNWLAQVLIGKYRRDTAIQLNRSVHDTLMRSSRKPSKILGGMFRNLASVAFEDNQEIMRLVVFTTNPTPMIRMSLIVPTKESDGSLSGPEEGYNVEGGPFIFPDYNFGIDFSEQKGIVKIVWAANKSRHFTLLAPDTVTHSRIALSLQINKKTRDDCDNIKTGKVMTRPKTSVMRTSCISATTLTY